MKKNVFVLAFLFPFFLKAQNVGVGINTPLEKFHLVGSFLVNTTSSNDTVQNSSISNGQQFFYNAAKGALRFGNPNGTANWYNSNTGLGSFAFGAGSVASTFGSFAYGFNTIASGAYATALGGYGNIADGYGSVAGGSNSIAKNSNAFAFGDNLIVKNSNGAVFGAYNDSTVGGYFSVGNGSGYSNRNTAFFVQTNGNVGIGASIAQQPLTVDSFAVIDQGDHNTGVKADLTFGGNSGEGVGSARQSGNTNRWGLDFYTNNLKRMSVSNSGNVGIGTSNPLFTFHTKAISGEQVITYAEGDNTSFASSYINGTTASSFVGTGMQRQSTTRGYVGINPNNDLVLARVRPSQGLEAAVTVSNANGYVGVGTTTPGFVLDVFDAANQGFFANFTSNNASNSFLQIQANAAGTNVANIGLGLYRNSNAKGYFYVNGSNNFIWTTNGSEQVALTPAGNLGIGQNNPGFPLNFASSLGDKIALYGNSGNTYGFGIAANALQIHTDIAGSDVAFGYGSSAAFTETMRVKGNGNLNVKGDIITDINGTNNGFASPGLRFGTASSGEAISSKRTAGGNQNGLDLYTNGAARISIDNSGLVGINGNTTPGARLQVNQTGNYNNSEGSTHAFEIWDNNETLYMGADGGNSISYIQAVGNSTFHTLALQARGGNVAIGKSTATEKIDVNGNGAFSGNVSVQSGKGIIRNYTGTQLKTEMIPFTFPGLVALGAGNTTNLSVTFPETYTAAPMVYVAGLVPSSGSAGYLECVYNVVSISTTGFTLSIYNPRTSGATFNNGSPNFAINFVATGAQ